MKLQRLETVTSTMDIARENVLSGRIQFNSAGDLESGCDAGVMANEQTAGRGQRGRNWYARPGESLSATYYLRRGLTNAQSAPQLAFLAGVAVITALQAHCQTLASHKSAPDFGLKWPNDLLLSGRKLGGILIEIVTTPDSKLTALIGIGINTNVLDFPPELSSLATSLLKEGILVNQDELALEIASSLDIWSHKWASSGFPGILDAWRKYDRTTGRRFQTELDGNVVIGVAIGVDETGALLLQIADGRVITVTSASSLQQLSKDNE